jgi:hypothetical protein
MVHKGEISFPDGMQLIDTRYLKGGIALKGNGMSNQLYQFVNGQRLLKIHANRLFFNAF